MHHTLWKREVIITCGPSNLKTRLLPFLDNHGGVDIDAKLSVWDTPQPLVWTTMAVPRPAVSSRLVSSYLLELTHALGQASPWCQSDPFCQEFELPNHGGRLVRAVRTLRKYTPDSHWQRTKDSWDSLCSLRWCDGCECPDFKVLGHLSLKLSLVGQKRSRPSQWFPSAGTLYRCSLSHASETGCCRRKGWSCKKRRRIGPAENEAWHQGWGLMTSYQLLHAFVYVS